MRTHRTKHSIGCIITSIIALWAIASVAQLSAFAQDVKGKLETGRITSPALENRIGDPTTRNYWIYLPPSYKTSDKQYPSIYVLHGYGQQLGALTEIRPDIDSMIKNGKINETIVVFVDGYNRFHGSFFLSSETIGDYETYITKDLVNHIDANYRSIAHKDSRGITGFSMGGFGALHLALKFPDTFSVAVSQAGAFYDIDGDNWWSNLARQTASANPKNWGEFNRLSWTAQIGFALSAAVCPNPGNPPFFLDKPYEKVNGKIQVVPEMWERHVEAGIVDGDLPRYLKQPIRLNAIKIVHGTGDGSVPIGHARDLDKAMTDMGIDHVYEEHSGGHSFIADRSLQFLSDHLSGKLVETEPLEEQFAVSARSKLAYTWGTIKR